jgi:hypothetical protein
VAPPPINDGDGSIEVRPRADLAGELIILSGWTPKSVLGRRSRRICKYSTTAPEDISISVANVNLALREIPRGR